MRQVKNILTALMTFSLAFCLFGTPVAFGAEQSGNTIESTSVDAVADDPSLADLADESDSASAGTNDGVASARSAEAVAASAADIEGFRATLTQAWYDMPEGNIDLSAYGLTLDQANKVWLEIQYDNPLIFWDGEGRWHMRDGIVTGYQNDWSYSKSEVDAMMAAYEEKAAEAISWTSDDMSDFEKATALNDYLIWNASYQYDTASDLDYTAYGILVNGTGRCAGYAKAYQDLLGRVGIAADYVIGTAKGGSHAWNHIGIDGAWYAVDVTWNDACYLIDGTHVDTNDYDGKVSHKYLLKSDMYMAANGYVVKTAKHTANDAQYDYNHTWPTYSAPAPKKPLCEYCDVASTDWYVADGTLDYVVQNGLMKGCNGLFRPSDAITRAEFATILWRYANPASAASYNTASARNTTAMADVESGSFYTEAANWCVEQGVITGVKTASGALFQPNRAVTREEAAAMLVRFAQQQGAAIAPSAKNSASLGAFYDVQDCSSWAISPLACAHEHGIISGSGNYLRPQDATTRCEAAALLKKTIELIEGPRGR